MDGHGKAAITNCKQPPSIFAWTIRPFSRFKERTWISTVDHLCLRVPPPAHTQNKLVLDFLSASHVAVDRGQSWGSGLRNVFEVHSPFTVGPWQSPSPSVIQSCYLKSDWMELFYPTRSLLLLNRSCLELWAEKYSKTSSKLSGKELVNW